MKIRITTLWKVPLLCIVGSILSYYLTVYFGGYFFAVSSIAADGSITLSADPIRSIVFDIALFTVLLLIGGLCFLRNMTKAEIAVSAAIISAIYLLIVLAQLLVPGFPISLSVKLAVFQNWTGMLSAVLLKLTNQFHLSVLLSTLAPFLFIPFGRASI